MTQKINGILRIRTTKSISVRYISEFLGQLDQTYASISNFESNIDDQFRFLSSIESRSEGFTPELKRMFRYSFERRFFETAVKSNLMIFRVSVNSPGFWDVIGNLNPLLHIREYLKEAHERGKDMRYREEIDSKGNELDLERKRLEIEKLRIENQQLEENYTLENAERRLIVLEKAHFVFEKLDIDAKSREFIIDKSIDAPLSKLLSIYNEEKIKGIEIDPT
jgi:hypothetical protein